jgi:hypothetical protein
MAVDTAPNFYPVSSTTNPSAAPPTTEPPPGTDTPDAAELSARAILFNFLEETYGLGELADWAWNLKKAGASDAEIQLQIPQQPAFIRQYPAYAELAKRGEAISIPAYRAYTLGIKESLKFYGIPDGIFDTPEAIGQMLLSNVSEAEAQERMAIAADAAYKAPAEVRAALQERLGLTGGSLVAYWLDPDRATPVLKQQYLSAQIQGAASASGMATTYSQYDRLAALGIDYGTARQGFDEANRRRDLTNTEFGQAESVTTEDVVGSVFGEAAQARRVEREAARRAANYRSAEGGAAAGQSGVSGLASANR